MNIALVLPSNNDDNVSSYLLPYVLAVIAPLIKIRFKDAELFYSDDENELLNADIVCCSGLTEAWDKVNALGAMLTSHGKRFIVGGQHVTALPDSLKFGEAFIGPLEDINGKNPLPLPDWNIFKECSERSYVLMTSRGCPFACRFCSSSSFWKRYASFPLSRVIAELQMLADRGAKHVFIFDDLFTVNMKRLKELAQCIAAEGLNTLEYSCLVRADTIKPDTIRWLRHMNVTGVAFGAESGSDIVLRAMNKMATVEQNQYCIDLLHYCGYKPNSGVVVGFPGETKKTLEQTKKFLEKNREKCVIDVMPVQPLPGTWLWQEFMKKYKPDLIKFLWKTLSIRANIVPELYYTMSEATIEDIKDICLFRLGLYDRTQSF